MLALHGGADQSLAWDGIAKRANSLEEGRRTCKFLVYPDVPHGFNADYRPSCRAEAVKDGWEDAGLLAKRHR